MMDLRISKFPQQRLRDAAYAVSKASLEAGAPSSLASIPQSVRVRVRGIPRLRGSLQHSTSEARTEEVTMTLFLSSPNLGRHVSASSPQLQQLSSFQRTSAFLILLYNVVTMRISFN
ncbi:uncharacterized protein LOC111865042 [Cryptotermes secundus]|uniref:uncharacterized protein LOC111865042 n=1 Tax=Cryptotermes secundus TaxID=105785 RepID=UPI000CD7B6AB|nr:uncharacterized protein LOC111865042 [Cryptotermes secundus]